jgi:hypothetical protein
MPSQEKSDGDLKGAEKNPQGRPPLIKILLQNGALLILPPMLISFGLWAWLPEAFQPAVFWKDVPPYLGTLENIFRMAIFAVPGFLYFGKSARGQTTGWLLYTVGLMLYLLSYLLLILWPESLWSSSAIGFSAAAWTPAFWLVGIGLVCQKTWLPIAWKRGIYLVMVGVFIFLHTGHALLVYGQVNS